MEASQSPECAAERYGYDPNMRKKWGITVAGVVAASLAGGCGSTVTTVTEKAAAPSVEGANASTSSTPKPAHQNAGLANPAQRPDSGVTAQCNEVPVGHACHASTASPSDPNQSPQRSCDPRIVANRSTSCALAENAFYESYESDDVAHKSFSIEVYSPVTHKNYELVCELEAPLIGCISNPTSDGIYVSFPQAAITAYTEAQAKAYASSRNVGNPPQPVALRPEGATPPESGGGESKGAESTGQDEVGSYSHAGDEAFCEEHECIGDFEGEDGYVVECEDGSYSHAGGKSGACSDHGGEQP